MHNLPKELLKPKTEHKKKKKAYKQLAKIIETMIRAET
jgi:hypothetical protein